MGRAATILLALISIIAGLSVRVQAQAAASEQPARSHAQERLVVFEIFTRAT